MLSKKQLLDIVLEEDDELLSRYALLGKKSARKRGVPYYGKLRELYPIHFQVYRYIIKQTGKVEFSHNLEGFVDFLLDIGEIPKGLSKPSIRVIDPSKGYTWGNVSWIEGDKEKLRKSFRTKRHLKKSTKSKQYRLHKFLLESKGCKIYIDNKFIDKFNYSSFYTLLRSLKQMGFTISLDSYGYYLFVDELCN